MRSIILYLDGIKNLFKNLKPSVDSHRSGLLPFKYYISKLGGEGSQSLLELCMQGGPGFGRTCWHNDWTLHRPISPLFLDKGQNIVWNFSFFFVFNFHFLRNIGVQGKYWSSVLKRNEDVVLNHFFQFPEYLLYSV